MVKKIIIYCVLILFSIQPMYAQSTTNTLDTNNDPEVIFNQALQELRDDTINNAILQLEKLLDYNTANPNYYIYLGYLYFIQVNYDKALPVLQKALPLNANIVIVHILIGEIYYQTKNILQARDEYEKVIKLNPDIKLAHIRLYELFKENNPEKANTHYLKIFQLPPTKLEKFLPHSEKIRDINFSANKTFSVLKDIKLEDKLDKNIVDKIFDESTQNTNQEKIIVSVKKDTFKINLNFFANPFKNFDNEKFFVKLIEVVFIGIFLFVYTIVLKKGEREFKKVVLTQYRMTTIKKE